ncbi:hypothetical protein [Hugenholtzia roseola]|nr:hypothetical protein [Hugenholtzia roseola]
MSLKKEGTLSQSEDKNPYYDIKGFYYKKIDKNKIKNKVKS